MKIPALLIGALMVGSLLVIGFFLLRWIDYASSAGERRAVESCQEAVLAQLRSPASAVFPEPPYRDELALEHLEATNIYIWSAYVDAQNGFGALLRNNFSCTVDTNGVATAVLFES